MVYFNYNERYDRIYINIVFHISYFVFFYIVYLNLFRKSKSKSKLINKLVSNNNSIFKNIILAFIIFGVFVPFIFIKIGQKLNIVYDVNRYEA